MIVMRRNRGDCVPVADVDYRIAKDFMRNLVRYAISTGGMLKQAWLENAIYDIRGKDWTPLLDAERDREDWIMYVDGTIFSTFTDIGFPATLEMFKEVVEDELRPIFAAIMANMEDSSVIYTEEDWHDETETWEIVPTMAECEDELKRADSAASFNKDVDDGKAGEWEPEDNGQDNFGKSAVSASGGLMHVGNAGASVPLQPKELSRQQVYRVFEAYIRSVLVKDGDPDAMKNVIQTRRPFVRPSVWIKGGTPKEDMQKWQEAVFRALKAAQLLGYDELIQHFDSVSGEMLRPAFVEFLQEMKAEDYIKDITKKWPSAYDEDGAAALDHGVDRVYEPSCRPGPFTVTGTRKFSETSIPIPPMKPTDIDPYTGEAPTSVICSKCLERGEADKVITTYTNCELSHRPVWCWRCGTQSDKE